MCGRRHAGEGKGQGGRSVYGPGVGKSGEEERSQLEGIVSVCLRDASSRERGGVLRMVPGAVRLSFSPIGVQ